MGWREEGKRRAAGEAAKHIENGFIVGLGSGSTVAYAIQAIGKRIRQKKLKVLGVPTSHQTAILAARYGIPLTTLNEYSHLDLVIDGSEIEHNKTKYEVTHIDEESTTSNNYKDYPSCTIGSLKAGTYFVSFSCVTRNSNNNGWSYIILNKGGSDIAHTERRMQGNKESSLSTVAVVTVNGSEDIKVRIRRDTKGSAEFSNASLVAVRLGD